MVSMKWNLNNPIGTYYDDNVDFDQLEEPIWTCVFLARYQRSVSWRNNIVLTLP